MAQSRRACFIFYLLAANLSVAAQAAELLVPEDHSTIQSAINAASGGDTVSVAPGTYSLSSPLDFTGKAVAVVGRDGPPETILRATGTNSLALLVGVDGPQGRLEGFTLRAGTPEIVQRGGCVSIEGGSPTIANNRFENCSTIQGNARSSGGAIKVISDASPLIVNNTFVGNRSFSQGGAVHILQAGGTVQANVFENNVVSGQPESGGGGLKITFSTGDPVEVSDNVFRSNSASFAGSAISAFGSDVHILNNEITGNGPSRFGGGIHLETQSDSGGNREFRVIGNLIENNFATDTVIEAINFDAVSGGGMHINLGPQGETTDSVIEIRGNTIAGNSARDSRCDGTTEESCGVGGGIEFLNARSAPQLVADNLFSDNIADRYAAANFDKVRLVFENNLVTGNRAAWVHPGIGCVASSNSTAVLCTIERNRFIDNRFLDGSFGSARLNNAGAVNVRRNEGWIINNLFVRNRGHFSTVFIKHDDVSGSPFSRIEHNTFVDNEREKPWFGSVAMVGNASIRNNAFVGDWRAFRMDASNSTSMVAANNVTDTIDSVARFDSQVFATVPDLNTGSPLASGNTANPPGFSAPETGDYALLAESALVDAGACIDDVTTDIRGISRPSGSACDTGAFEHGTDVIFGNSFE